jgi:peptidoglycan/LPS O-acetylase OafA/YrhL
MFFSLWAIGGFQAMSETVGSVLDRNKGEGPGFGVLRLALAATILFLHARHLAQLGQSPGLEAVPGAGAPAGAPWAGPMRTIFLPIVPAFFALSGFLVTGSALRVRATSTFLMFRVLRILPALLVEVTLSALVLGPIFTTLPLRHYFSDPQFFRYFGNIVGWITFYLPGVFHDNIYPTVNGNLWTLPAELDCYLITGALLLTGLAYRRGVLTLTVCLATVVFIGLNTFSDFAVTRWQYEGHTIVYYFFVGMLFFHWRDYVPMRWSLFLVSLVAGASLISLQHAVYLAPIFVVYSTVFLGVSALPELRWLRTRDYSYGIYLYGYPITQALVAAVPTLRGHIIVAVPLAILATLAFASASWHFIERPALSLKRWLPQGMFPLPVTQPSIATTPTYVGRAA